MALAQRLPHELGDQDAPLRLEEDLQPDEVQVRGRIPDLVVRQELLRRASCATCARRGCDAHALELAEPTRADAPCCLDSQQATAERRPPDVGASLAHMLSYQAGSIKKKIVPRLRARARCFACSGASTTSGSGSAGEAGRPGGAPARPRARGAASRARGPPGGGSPATTTARSATPCACSDTGTS